MAKITFKKKIYNLIGEFLKAEEGLILTIEDAE